MDITAGAFLQTCGWESAKNITVKEDTHKRKQNHKHVLPNKSVVYNRIMNHHTVYCSRNRSWLRYQTLGLPHKEWPMHQAGCARDGRAQNRVQTPSAWQLQEIGHSRGGVVQNTPSQATNWDAWCAAGRLNHAGSVLPNLWLRRLSKCGVTL
jgi:hypothetical protein